ncbi:MAG TPA: flavodoxin family protein [Candidatus Heimdallarchaeota archaeon]|nr:flavodoxin family protein [Candidatus Heimdallarchaeota archaeon]
MRVVAVMGSYRKGKTIDTLVDKAIEGVESVDSEAEVEKITLVDRDIQYCRNCGVCRNDDPAKPIARCAIDDDMQEILPVMREADAYIFGVPIFEGIVNAVTKTFLERICWTLARAGRWPVRGCPEPRTDRPKRVIAILSTGLIVPVLRRFCDDATSLIKTTIGDLLNAKLVGTLYAGAVEKVGIECYLVAAQKLGRKLAR